MRMLGKIKFLCLPYILSQYLVEWQFKTTFKAKFASFFTSFCGYSLFSIGCIPVHLSQIIKFRFVIPNATLHFIYAF